MTEIVDWHSEVSEAVYHNPLLEKMGKLAREERLKNMSSGEIVGQAIQAKVVLTEFPERSEWCVYPLSIKWTEGRHTFENYL